MPSRSNYILLAVAALAFIVLCGGWGTWKTLRARSQLALIRDIEASRQPGAAYQYVQHWIEPSRGWVITEPVGPEWIRREIREDWLRGVDRVVQLEWPGAGDNDLARLSQMTELERVLLIKTRVSGSGLRYLTSLSHLRVLDLSESPVTDEGATHLSRMRFEILNLGSTKFTDRGLSDLAACEQLDLLILDSTYVTDEGLKHLSGLHHLKGLALRSTAITDEGIRHLSGLSHLEMLFLDETAVTDGSIAVLSQFPLKELSVRGSRMSEKGLGDLSRKLPDCEIAR